jgi:hypothetical protein
VEDEWGGSQRRIEGISSSSWFLNFDFTRGSQRRIEGMDVINCSLVSLSLCEDLKGELKALSNPEPPEPTKASMKISKEN